MTTTTPAETGLALSNQSDPPPLEQSDPELAEQLRLIANQQHPVVKTLVSASDVTAFITHDGQQIIRRRKAPGRNDPCYCGSGKKFKRCCLPG